MVNVSVQRVIDDKINSTCTNLSDTIVLDSNTLFKDCPDCVTHKEIGMFCLLLFAFTLLLLKKEVGMVIAERAKTATLLDATKCAGAAMVIRALASGTVDMQEIMRMGAGVVGMQVLMGGGSGFAGGRTIGRI